MREEKTDQSGSLRSLKSWALCPGIDERACSLFPWKASKCEELLTSRWDTERETERSGQMALIPQRIRRQNCLLKKKRNGGS